MLTISALLDGRMNLKTYLSLMTPWNLYGCQTSSVCKMLRLEHNINEKSDFMSTTEGYIINRSVKKQDKIR